MKLIASFLIAAACAVAQQSISSPATVGGVNCGELRLLEAASTGGLLYSTLKTCRNAFSRLETTFIDGAGTSVMKLDAGGLFQIQSIGVRNTLSGGDVAQMVYSTASAGAVNVWTNNANSPSIRLEGKDSGTNTFPGLSLFADGGNLTAALLGGTTGGTSGRFSLYTSAGALGFFASGSGTASTYQGSVERVRLSTDLKVYDSGGTVRSTLSSIGLTLNQQTAPSAPAAGNVILYGKTGSGTLCSKDDANNETCYAAAGGAPANMFTTDTVQTATALKTFGAGATIVSNLSIKQSTGSADSISAYTSSGVGFVNLWTNTANAASLRLEGKDSGTNTYPGISLFADGGSLTASILGGTIGGSAGRLNLYTSSGVLGVFASGSGIISVYSSGTERTRVSTDFKAYDSSGFVRGTLSDAGLKLSQQAAPSAPASGDVLLYAKTGSGTLCSKDVSGTETCYVGSSGAPGNMVTTDTTQSITGTKTFDAPMNIAQSGGGGNKFQFQVLSSSAYMALYNSGGTLGAQLYGDGSGLKLYAGGVIRVDANDDIDINDGAGTRRLNMSSAGLIFSQQAAPIAPAAGDIKLYAKTGSSNLCSKDSTGTEICYASTTGGSYVDLSSTQTITGAKTFTSTVTLDATNGFQATDTLGTTQIYLRNRFGENGVVLYDQTYDIADLIIRGSSGTQRTIRLENRWASSLTYLEPSPEFQFGDMSLYPNGIGFMANANGAGVYKGDYFKWYGSSSGYVSVTAPSTVTSYNFYWPSSLGSNGQALCIVNAALGTTGWCTVSGGSSGVDLTSNQDISGIKYFSTASRAFETSVRATTSSGNVWTTYATGGSALSTYWPSSSASIATLNIYGNYAGSGTSAFEFLDPSSSNQRVLIRGGSNSILPSVQINGTSAAGVIISAGSSTNYGSIRVFDSSTNQLIHLDGQTGSIKWGSSSLVGLTTTVTVPCGTLTFTHGALTNKGTC